MGSCSRLSSRLRQVLILVLEPESLASEARVCMPKGKVKDKGKPKSKSRSSRTSKAVEPNDAPAAGWSQPYLLGDGPVRAVRLRGRELFERPIGSFMRVVPGGQAPPGRRSHVGTKHRSVRMAIAGGQKSGRSRPQCSASGGSSSRGLERFGPGSSFHGVRPAAGWGRPSQGPQEGPLPGAWDGARQGCPLDGWGLLRRRGARRGHSPPADCSAGTTGDFPRLITSEEIGGGWRSGRRQPRCAAGGYSVRWQEFSPQGQPADGWATHHSGPGGWTGDARPINMMVHGRATTTFFLSAGLSGLWHIWAGAGLEDSGVFSNGHTHVA